MTATGAGLAWGLALVLGGLNWVAVWYRCRPLIYGTKPATLLAILIGAWLLTRGPHDGWQTPWFLAGLVFSLTGDIFLMLPGGTRLFLAGLGAFFLAHVCYIVGLNPTLPPLAAWPVAVVIGGGAGLLWRRIAVGVRERRQPRLLFPAAAYALILSLMAGSAWATLFRPEWAPLRRTWVITGGTLFFTSDALLAWERFVRPSRVVRVMVMVTYHLAQLALAASLALW